ncbi:MAG TPA: hypothetical protein VHL14_06095 [Steroidobacteraceae bacterium]|nr:hypothetical protein [Steroidobacteraceae bacterium]
MNTYLSLSLRMAIATLLGTCAVSIPAFAAPPSNSAYSTDLQNSHVEDATSEGISQVNMITCIMHSMRPDALVNQGPYIALVDENKCSPDKSSSSNSGGGDASQASNYTTTVVNSTRLSNLDPMRVKVWLAEEDGGQQSTIFVNINATAAPTTANPYGQFRLDFCGKAADGSGSCMMNGMLQGADGALDYYQVEQRDGGQSTTALRLTSVGTTTGSGKLDMVRPDNGGNVEVAFLFSYDATHFLRGDQCFSRDASDPATGMSVWRYGLYNSTTGARVDLNSGFPLNFTNNGQTYHGFIGYWGINMPASAGLTNGATVQKVDYNNNSATTTNYTAVIAGGKLTKYTRKATNLHAIDKVQINTWVQDASNFFSGAASFTSYNLYWDDANSNFVVTGMNICSNNGCSSQDLQTPQTVSPAFWSQQGLQGNSQSLGGEVYIDLKNVGSPVNSASINVVYRAQDLVYPSDMPAHLYCVNNCPTDVALNSYLNGSANGPTDSPFDSTTFNNWSPSATYITYGADTNAGVLTTGGNAVVAADSSAYQQHSQYMNGVRSGRLFTDPSAVACNGSMYCDYKANDLNVYYIWETGPNNWNQFAAVKDANNEFVKFEAPMQLTYTVPSDSVRYGQYAGKSIVLQYGGFGNLWGIPGSCVSSVTNQPISCDQQNSRYVPEFVIPFSLTEGAVSDGTNTYLVKWLDREIRFARKSLSACSGLTLPGSVTLPTSAVLKDPSDATSDIYIGTKPAVTGQPRVIQGEVMY